jgi:MGT family glycosyltransferase
MSSILVCASPTPGHVNPMLALAGELRKNGHHVLFNTSDVFRSRVEAAGMSFVPLDGIANYDYRGINELYPDMAAAASGIDRLNYMTKYLVGDQISDQYNGVQRIIGKHEIKVILVDLVFLGVFPLLFRKNVERPAIVSCGVLAPMLRLPEISPFSGPDSTLEGLKRNAKDNLTFGQMLSRGNSYVDQVLRSFGVTIPGGFTYDSLYTEPDVFLQLTAKEFEFPSRHWPPNVRFIGPIPAQSSAANGQPQWLQTLDQSQPVVFVTQGTLTNFDFNQLVRPAIEALKNEAVQVVVTAGGGKMEDIPKAPNVHVERYLPYEVILPKTAVFVTNGGYNGVQQSLSYGVPVVSGGASEDKPQVSARVAWSGAGIDLRTGTPTPEQIRKAVLDVLNNNTYRERANALKEHFASYNALKTAAEIVSGLSLDKGVKYSTRSFQT